MDVPLIRFRTARSLDASKDTAILYHAPFVRSFDKNRCQNARRTRGTTTDRDVALLLD